MLEILQFYVSGFWVWLGITIGIGSIGHTLVVIIVGGLGALRGGSVHIGDKTDPNNPHTPQ